LITFYIPNTYWIEKDHAKEYVTGKLGGQPPNFMPFWSLSQTYPEQRLALAELALEVHFRGGDVVIVDTAEEYILRLFRRIREQYDDKAYPNEPKDYPYDKPFTHKDMKVIILTRESLDAPIQEHELEVQPEGDFNSNNLLDGIFHWRGDELF